MLLRHSLLFVLLGLAVGVFGKGEDLTSLNNALGETPCSLEGLLREPCSDAQTRDVYHERDDPISLRPSPSSCTCNYVFFNVWSACLLSNEIPVYIFGQWQAECQGSSIPISNSFLWNDTRDIDIPLWAWAVVPLNDTFDIGNALKASKSPTNWTALQKALPIIASLVTVATLGLLYLWHKRHKLPKMRDAVRISRRRLRLLPRARKVRKADRNNAWTIDLRDESDEDYDFIGRPSEEGYPRGHVRLSSSPTPLAKLQEPEGPFPFWEPHVVERIRAFADLVPRPWKTKTIHIELVERSQRFQVDNEDASTISGPSRRSTLDIQPAHKTKSQKSSIAGRTFAPIPENDSEDEGDDSHRRADTDESDLLIPRGQSEQGVVLISRQPGVNFSSTESGHSNPMSGNVHVTPPTPTTSQHSPLRQELQQGFARPSPLPPILPRPSPPRLKKPSQENMYQPHVSPPQTSQNNPAPQAHRQGSLETLRRSPAQIRRPSADALFFPSSPLPARQPSVEDMSYQSHHQLSQPTHQPPNTPFIAPPSPSLSYQALGEIRSRTPSSPLPPHRRGFSADDAISTLRLPVGSPSPHNTPHTHHRNLSMDSVIPSQSDPVMLFPGSVRAAGYTVPSGSYSSESLYSNPSMAHSQPPGLV